MTIIPPGTITRAVFSIGYKELGSSSNDSLTLGKYGGERTTVQLYAGYSSSITVPSNGWHLYTVSSGENIAKHELVSLNTNNSGTFLEWIQGEDQFDIYVQDDTSVDFVHLGLCITPNQDAAVTGIDSITKE